MNDLSWVGWAGGIGGSAIGVLGGAIGCYCAIRATRGPRERSHVIRGCIVIFAIVIAFLTLLFMTPVPYKWFWWIPYPILLVAFVRWFNARQMQMRALDAGAAPADGAAGPTSSVQ